MSVIFKPAIWHPIAVGLTLVNVLGGAFAAGSGEPWHATVHAALAIVCWAWARRLRPRAGGGELQAGLDTLEAELGRLRQELLETQERLDFAERMLAQGPDKQRVDQPR